MPIHVRNRSRRAFLRSAAIAAGGGCLAWPDLGDAALPNPGDDSAGNDANFFALLSDTHIPKSPEVNARGVNMTANLRKVIAEIEGLSRRPNHLMINGDCAYLKGLADDYKNLSRCLAPLDPLGIDLHLAMGNHDDRVTMYDAFRDHREETPVVDSKHVSVIESQFANWFLLDSLFRVNLVTGEVGKAQLDWLGKALDARQDKPALVMVHHNPQFKPPAKGKPWGGISDTESLFEVLTNRPHVKALFYGHTHHWEQKQRDGLQLINLPPVAYVFSSGRPNGWVAAKLSAGELRLELNTLNPDHKNAGQTIEIDLT